MRAQTRAATPSARSPSLPTPSPLLSLITSLSLCQSPPSPSSSPFLSSSLPPPLLISLFTLPSSLTHPTYLVLHANLPPFSLLIFHFTLPFSILLSPFTILLSPLLHTSFTFHSPPLSPSLPFFLFISPFTLPFPLFLSLSFPFTPCSPPVLPLISHGLCEMKISFKSPHLLAGPQRLSTGLHFKLKTKFVHL